VTGAPTVDTADDTPPEGTPIDPELLRLIQRVAHREHLLDGAVNPGLAPRSRTTSPRSPARRRPAVGNAHSTSVRVTRGTTARKVTWS
jgi:hypothetical protein